MDSTVLLGAEDVRAGGNAIERAADRMANAASTIEYALRQHEQFMDDWLRRFQDALETSRRSLPAEPGQPGNGGELG
jgi:hypothetical protein